MKNLDKNLEQFEKHLEEMDQVKAQTGALRAIRSELRRHAKEISPSQEEQRWAWNRLEARLNKPSLFVRWRTTIHATGWAFAASLLILGAFYVQFTPPPGMNSSASINILKVMDSDPQISAVAFHANESEELAADVFWVSGYDYIPSEYHFE
jgi:hypothetical protein